MLFKDLDHSASSFPVVLSQAWYSFLPGLKDWGTLCKNSRAVSQISSLLFACLVCLKILAILASLISDPHLFNWGEGRALSGFSFPAHWLETASRRKAGATVGLTFLSPFPQRSQVYFALYPMS